MDRRALTLQVAPRTELTLRADGFGLTAAVFVQPGRNTTTPIQAAHYSQPKRECVPDRVRVDPDCLWLGSSAFAFPADAAGKVAAFLTDAGIPYATRAAQVAATPVVEVR